MSTVATMTLINPDSSIVLFTIDESVLIGQGYWRGPVEEEQAKIEYANDWGFAVETGSYGDTRLKGELELLLQESDFRALQSFTDLHWQYVRQNLGESGFVTFFDTWEPLREYTRIRSGGPNFTGTPTNVNKFYPRFQVLLTHDEKWFEDVSGNYCNGPIYKVKFGWVENKRMTGQIDTAIVPVITALADPMIYGTTYTGTGTNILQATGANINGVSVPFAVLSDTSFSLIAQGSTGTVDITLLYPSGTSAVFSTTITGVPTYTSLSPSNPSPGQSVILTGTNFYNGFTPTFTGGTAPAFTYVNATTMTFPAPSTGGYTVGGLTLTVGATPTYTSLSSTAPTQGSTVTITGAGFYNGLVPQYAGGAVPVFTFVNSTTITFIAPSMGSYAVGGLTFTVGLVSLSANMLTPAASSINITNISSVALSANLLTPAAGSINVSISVAITRANAYIAAVNAVAPSSLSSGQATAIQNFFVSIHDTASDSTNIWGKMFQVFPRIGGNAASHLIDAKLPGTNPASFNGGLTHDSSGVTGNGSTGYFDTGLPMTTLSSAANLFIAQYRTWSGTPADVEVHYGVYNPGTTAYTADFHLFSISISDRAYFSSTTNYATVSGSSALYGALITNRLSSGEGDIISNGSVLASITGDTSTLLHSESLHLYSLARNNNGTMDNPSSLTEKFFAWGEELTNTQALALSNAMTTLETALGRA